VQLLVSVADPDDAAAAAAGGADVVDAKDPSRGALGAVTPLAFARIRRVVTAPTSAAIGDAVDDESVERDARMFRTAGALFVKVGFAGTSDAARLARILDAARRGAGDAVVAVAYADADRAGAPPSSAVLEAAARAGAAGVLLDTSDKSGPGVRRLITAPALADWVRAAREARLRVAIAGQLTAADLSFVRDLGADIAGVRGAACIGGRTGRISSRLVRALRQEAQGLRPMAQALSQARGLALS
jgi:uncharacterized protein (UPF0264 family)